MGHELRRSMKSVFPDQSVAMTGFPSAMQGRLTIRESFSPRAVGEMYRRRLQALAEGEGRSEPRDGRVRGASLSRASRGSIHETDRNSRQGRSGRLQADKNPPYYADTSLVLTAALRSRLVIESSPPLGK
jgi:hypothetical protein